MATATRLLLALCFTCCAFGAYPNGYTYRRAITIDHTKVSNVDQTNFPILYSGTYSYLATTANAGSVQNASGFDIIFTSDANGSSKLNWEIEQYTAATGVILAWVQIPTLSASVDTVFYLFYGNSSVSSDQSNKTGTWDTFFKGVYHLPNGTTLNATDSTTNANNGTINGATANAGKTDGGGGFVSGSSQYIGMGNVLDVGASDYSIHCWIKYANATQYGAAVAKRQTVSNFQQYIFGVGSINSSGGAVSAKTLFLFDYDGTSFQGVHTSATTFANNTFHHVVATRASSGLKIYVDGVAVTLVTDSAGTASENASNTGNFNIGWENGTGYFNGSLDEVRVSIGSARSADWVKTDYNSENSPSTFYAVGAEQTLVQGVSGILIEM